MKDYYAILGLQRNATDAQIEAKYRFLAKEFHPDRNPLSAAEPMARAMAEINEAYEVLGDPKKRRAYDLQFKVRPMAVPGKGIDLVGLVGAVLGRYSVSVEVSDGLTNILGIALEDHGISARAATGEQILRATGLLKKKRRARKSA